MAKNFATIRAVLFSLQEVSFSYKEETRTVLPNMISMLSVFLKSKKICVRFNSISIVEEVIYKYLQFRIMRWYCHRAFHNMLEIQKVRYVCKTIPLTEKNHSHEVFLQIVELTVCTKRMSEIFREFPLKSNAPLPHTLLPVYSSLLASQAPPLPISATPERAEQKCKCSRVAILREMIALVYLQKKSAKWCLIEV